MLLKFPSARDPLLRCVLDRYGDYFDAQGDLNKATGLCTAFAHVQAPRGPWGSQKGNESEMHHIKVKGGGKQAAMLQEVDKVDMSYEDDAAATSLCLRQLFDTCAADKLSHPLPASGEGGSERRRKLTAVTGAPQGGRLAVAGLAGAVEWYDCDHNQLHDNYHLPQQAQQQQWRRQQLSGKFALWLGPPALHGQWIAPHESRSVLLE